MTRRGRSSVLALSATLIGAPGAVQAGGACTVPGSHPTIQAAIDDVGCGAVQLQAGVYAESVIVRRSLSIAGPAAGGAVIEGRVTGSGPDTVLDLVDLLVENGCTAQALDSAQGARLQGLGLEVVRDQSLPCPAQQLFGDGFESGDTSAWDEVAP